jgi:GUN4-like.
MEIDQIWMKHSQGKFGLVIQLKVWQEVGRPSSKTTQTKATNTVLWDRFGDRIGWRNGFRWLTYYDLKPSASSAAGMLPYYGFWFGQTISNLNVDSVERQLASLFLHLEKCGF